MRKAQNYIQENYQKDLSLDEVSRQLDLSPYYFSKLFKEETGSNFVEYLTNSGTSEMTTEDQAYEYYGVGNKEDGKKTLRQLYVVNKAISFVVENANITVEPDTETEETTEQ